MHNVDIILKLITITEIKMNDYREKMLHVPSKDTIKIFGMCILAGTKPEYYINAKFVGRLFFIIILVMLFYIRLCNYHKCNVK